MVSRINQRAFLEAIQVGPLHRTHLAEELEYAHLMEIRQATIDDYEGLNRLFGEADRLHHEAEPTIFKGESDWGRSREFIALALEDPNQILYLATVGAEIIGLIHLAAQHKSELGVLYARNSLVVDALIVRECSGGAGVGTLLMAKGQEWGEQRGLAVIELTVWSFNSGAEEFYRRLGFAPSNLRMRKALK